MVLPMSAGQKSAEEATSDEPAPDAGDFERQVRDALTHLYDAVYLQTHPLARIVQCQDQRMPRSLLGKSVHQSLLGGIDAVRPAAGTPASSKACLRYRIMELRYIEGVDAVEVQRELAISKSEYYREHGRALETVVAVLWDRWHPSQQARPLPRPETTDRTALLQRETEELGAAVPSEPLDLDLLIREVVDLLAPLAQRRGIALSAQRAPACSAIGVDRVLARQALLSLLHQAMDTVSPGRLQLCADPDPTGVRLRMTAVSPDGTARPPSDGELLATQQLIDGFRGTLARHVVAGGYAIELVLPPQHGPTLLVVDNNADFIALVSRYISRHGWSVIGACRAEEVRALVAHGQPQLILLDVLMPGQDGWDVLRMLKALPHGKHIPVIICSVLNEPQLALALGADAYLPKPVRQRDLLQLLADQCSDMRGASAAPRAGPPAGPSAPGAGSPQAS